jgi:multidrug resistance protein MdtO
VAFLRRELAPTPGRGKATFRLVLICLVATIPILTHRLPNAAWIIGMLYMMALEDTAASIIGSIMTMIAVTVGLGAALLACAVSMDLPWLRVCFLIAFLFGGMFLSRALRLGGLVGFAGVLAAVAMTFPDKMPPRSEVIVEGILWLWWSIILGLSVSAGVQLLIPSGDPLSLLRRDLETRLLAVEQALRRLAGAVVLETPAASLNTLAITGMSGPLKHLKIASAFNPWARERREGLAAVITLTDRLVTAAVALEARALPTERCESAC